MEENNSVLFNKETGLAEAVPQEFAEHYLSNKTHEFPLNDPEGNPVSAPYEDVQKLIAQGYSQPTNDQLQSLLNHAKYSSPTEQAKNILSKAASAATFGASTAVEEAFGRTQEEREAAEETNPIGSMVGSGIGLVGSALIPGFGEYKAATEAALAAKSALKAGTITAEAAAPIIRAGARAINPLSAQSIMTGAGVRTAEALGLGLEGAGIVSKIGSAAAKGAVENALFQAGDEASKIIAGKPADAEGIITDIGLSGLIGAGVSAPFGAISPLWKSAKESSLGKVLSAIKDKADGSATTLVPKSIDQAIASTGIELSPEIRAGLSDNPELRHSFQILRESETKSGRALQDAIGDFKEQTQNAILGAFGKSPEALTDISNFSQHEAGQKLQETIANEIERVTKPLAEKFESVKEKFAGTPVSEQAKNEITEQLAEINKRFKVTPSAPEHQKLNTMLTELKNVSTLEDLRNFQSNHLSDIADKHLWGINTPVRTALRDAEEKIVMSELGKEAPELLEQHKVARSGWREATNMIDDLNDRLKVGRYNGPGGFLYNLREMTPEAIASRIAKTNDANLLNFLSEKLPETAALVKQYHMDQLLKSAVQKAPAGEMINTPSLLKKINEMSPELRNWLMPAGTQEKIAGINALIDALPGRKNPSGTAGTLAKLLSHYPAGVGAMVSILTGGHGAAGGAAGYLLGHVLEHVTRDAPDAAKLALLKFLGSNAPMNPGAFKAMADFAGALVKSEKIISNAASSVFKAGREVLPKSLMPTEKKREALKKRIDDLQSNAGDLMHTGGDVGYYLPEHNTALSMTASRAVQYLGSLKPNTQKQAPLDAKPIASKAQTAAYNRALDIAEQPMLIMGNIRDGSITPQDVTTFRTLYPALYSQVSQKLYNGIIEANSKDQMIPYRTRLGLSLFLGKDLDSTMTPQAIVAAQPQQPNGQPAAAGGPVPPGGKSKGSMASLSKMPGMFMTPQQARQADRSQS